MWKWTLSACYNCEEIFLFEENKETECHEHFFEIDSKIEYATTSDLDTHTSNEFLDLRSFKSEFFMSDILY